MIIIKLIQEVLNKTQQDIANDLGVSRQTISMWYSGYKISKKNLEAINKKYNIPMYLLEKAQISGIQLSEDDLKLIEGFLLKSVTLNSDNEFLRYILKLIGADFVKSSNFDEFLNVVNLNKIQILGLDEVEFCRNNKYLFIIDINTTDLFECLSNIRKIGSRFEYSYLIRNSKIDSIKVVIFGGDKNEVKNT